MASSTLWKVSFQVSIGGGNKIGDIHNESTSRDRHGSQQGRANALPETTKTLDGIGLLEAVTHAGELLSGTEPVGLHLTLDHVEGVARQPQSLTSQTTVGGHLDSRDILALNIVALGIHVHHVLESHEPGTVGHRLTQNCDRLAAVQTAQGTSLSGKLLHAVNGTRVQATSAVGLGLKTDTDVLDRAREHGVGYTGERTGQPVLAVRECAVGILLLIQLLNLATRLVESAKLNTDLWKGLDRRDVKPRERATYTGTDSDKGSQSTLVESGGALLLEDLGRAVQSTLILRGGLQADLYDICDTGVRQASLWAGDTCAPRATNQKVGL